MMRFRKPATWNASFSAMIPFCSDLVGATLKHRIHDLNSLEIAFVGPSLALLLLLSMTRARHFDPGFKRGRMSKRLQRRGRVPEYDGGVYLFARFHRFRLLPRGDLPPLPLRHIQEARANVCLAKIKPHKWKQPMIHHVRI